jgi:predicted TPR repeat methyltransferase
MVAPDSPGGERETLHVSFAEAVRVAIELHRQQRLDEAEGLYRRLLGARPDDVDVNHFLGVLLAQRGDFAAAEGSIRAAVNRSPGYVDAQNNLGNVLFQLKRIEEAGAQYELVLQLAPQHAGAWNNLGNVRRNLGNVAGAIAAYETAIGHDAAHADAHQNLGNAYRNIGRLDDAIAQYRKALALRGDKIALYMHLGRTLFRHGRLDEAAAVYRQWLQREPGNAIASHMLAACSGQATPERASDAFVKATFDAFAEDFDEVLGELQYRAPQLVAEAIVAAVGPAARVDVLDAGCGTGLCGPLLRSVAQRLVGIDLSPAMLSRARERRAYDELIETEVIAWAEAHAAEFDVVASADVLVYFGDLFAVLRAFAAVLRPGGCLVFTTERAMDAARGFVLHPHGRYSHTVEHVAAALQAAGLELVRTETVQLRLEGGEPVGGSLTIARRAP